MSILTIIKIASYVLTAGIPAFIFIKRSIKKSKEHDKDMEMKDRTIATLRDQISDMAILGGEKIVVKNKVKKIKNKNVEKSDTDMSIDYGNKLHNLPTNKRRKKPVS